MLLPQTLADPLLSPTCAPAVVPLLLPEIAAGKSSNNPVSLEYIKSSPLTKPA